MNMLSLVAGVAAPGLARAQEAPASDPAPVATEKAAPAATSGVAPSPAGRGVVAPLPSVVAPPAAIRPNPAGEPVRLTLSDALNLALEENPGVGAVEDRIAGARARADAARALLDPNVSATGTLTRQGPISTITFPGQAGQPPQTITLGKPYTKTVSVNARKPFDLSGEVRVQRDIAQRGITSAELDLARAENDLLLSVYNAFYGVLRSDRFVNVAEEAVAAAQEQFRVAEVSYREGALARFDVTRAAVQVENLRQNLVTAQKNASLARAQLLNALGIGPATPIELVPVDLPESIGAPSLL
ncbi:MAG: TolC family protein, partial [Armatimonadetes bacterium]|nr:TolC family protein [Armatimonadota bacterium]